MTRLDLPSALVKLAIGLASATLVGGGTALLHAQATNAVQDQRISQLEQDRASIHELSNKLDETNRNVAILNERLEVIRGK